MKPTFTNTLKTLMLGGAIALAAGQTSQAAGVPVSSNASSVDLRVAKVRAALETANTVQPGQGASQADPGVMWWRNAWGNGGGWHNWHNGWHNGGWGNWHNF